MDTNKIAVIGGTHSRGRMAALALLAMGGNAGIVGAGQARRSDTSEPFKPYTRSVYRPYERDPRPASKKAKTKSQRDPRPASKKAKTKSQRKARRKNRK